MQISELTETTMVDDSGFIAVDTSEGTRKISVYELKQAIEGE